MSEYVLVRDGIVIARVHSPVLPEAQRDRLKLMRADEAALRADGIAPIEPTGDDLGALLRGNENDLDAERVKGVRLHQVRRAIADAEATLARSDRFLPADIYGDSETGKLLEWPRTYRSALLKATDHMEMPGWRSNKAAAVIATADAYRAALRALPQTCPDPSGVVFPERPSEV